MTDPFESGPFCIHWGEPCDCEEPCPRCGHKCADHDLEGGPCRKCECQSNRPEEKT